MKENEKEEILKRLGLPPDAPPDTISDRIAQLNQNYQVLARVPAKRALASEWLRFLDYAQGVLLGMPPQLRPDSPGESSQIRNTEPAAAQKPEQQLEHKEGLLAATEPGDSGLTTNGSIPKAHNQVRTGDTEENSFPGCEQPELIALQAILAPAPIELVKKPIAIPWWLTPGMIMALFLAPLLFHLKSSAAEQKNGAVPKQAISHATSLLRLGIYDWPSVVVHYSAVSDPSASIEVTTVHDIGSLMAKPGGPPISFNLIVVPFSAAVENSQTLKDAGWKLVWVCDESNGMDRILVNRNVQNDRERVIMGKWLAVKGTHSAHILDTYLNNTAHPENKRRYKNEQYVELNTAEELLDTIDKEEGSITAVAIHEPWADSSVIRENENNFEDDTFFALQNHNMHEINVLLAREEVLKQPELLRALVTFITDLIGFPSAPTQNGLDVTRILGRDPQLRTDFSFTAMGLNGADEQRILSHDLAVNLKSNLEFFFGFGPYKCDLIAADQDEHISWPDNQAHSPCSDLIDKAARNQIISEVQKAARNRPEFDNRELEELCSSDDATELSVTLSPFVLGQSDPAQPWKPFLSPAMQLDRFIGSSLTPAASYCILGHGDASGTPEWNQDLAKQRADRIKELLASHIYRFAPQKLVTVSRGNEDPLDAVDQDSNRRVEIRQIQFEISQ